jgi:SulP family sulfate permease
MQFSGEGESVPLGGVDLLNTSIRHDRRDPPVSERLKRFIAKEYSPQALIPSLTWVPDYLRGGWKNNLYNDVAAGLTVGAFLVPQGMSYALIAELPPIYGLYTASIPLIVYALLGTSRQLAVGPVAIMSLIVGHGVSSIVEPRLEDNSPNPEFIALVVATSLLNGILLSIMGILRLGFVTSFLSHPVVSGFTSAAALVIGIGQMKHVLGYNLSKSENFFEVFIDMLSRLGESHWPSVIMALMTMGLLYTFKNVKMLKKLPAAMIVVVISILVSWGLQLEANYGFKICGEIPGGIPVPQVSRWFGILGFRIPGVVPVPQV